MVFEHVSMWHKYQKAIARLSWFVIVQDNIGIYGFDFCKDSNYYNRVSKMDNLLYSPSWWRKTK